MVDEIARALGTDPVAFRRKTIGVGRAREPCSNQVVATGQLGPDACPRAPRRVSRCTTSTSRSSRTSSRSTAGTSTPRVTKGVCAVDVGRAVNPRGLEAQVQGVLNDGLSMTLHAGLHIDNGAVREGSYSDYHFARMADSPARCRGRRHAADR